MMRAQSTVQSPPKTDWATSVTIFLRNQAIRHMRHAIRGDEHALRPVTSIQAHRAVQRYQMRR